MNRRSFLLGAAGFLAAPALVRASSLMPVRRYSTMAKAEFFVVARGHGGYWVVVFGQNADGRAVEERFPILAVPGEAITRTARRLEYISPIRLI